MGWGGGDKECVKGYERVGEFAMGPLIQAKEPQAAVLQGWGLRTCPSSNMTLFDEGQAGLCLFGLQFPCLGNKE